MKNENDPKSISFLESEDSVFVIEIDDTGLNCLTVTTHVTDELAKSHPFWETVRDYMASPRFETRAIASIINSAVTQQRLMFAISRATLGTLFQNDPNWIGRNTDQLNSLEYKKILSALFGSGKFICIQESVGNLTMREGKPFVIQVVCPIIIRAIRELSGVPTEGLLEKQTVEMEKFVNFNFALKQSLAKIKGIEKRFKGNNDPQSADSWLDSDIKRLIAEYVKTTAWSEDYLKKLSKEAKFEVPKAQIYFGEWVKKHLAGIKGESARDSG